MPQRQERFGRSKRLSGPDFQHVLKEGKSLRGEILQVKVLPAEPAGRFACSIRRGVAKNAVTRNRFKRWLREAFRRNQEQIPSGFDLLVIATREFKSYPIVEKELISICKRLPR